MTKRYFNNESRKALLYRLIERLGDCVEDMDTSPAKPDDADAVYQDVVSLLERLEAEMEQLTQGPEFA